MVSKKLVTLLTFTVMLGQTGLLSTLFAEADTQTPPTQDSSSQVSLVTESLQVASVIQRTDLEPPSKSDILSGSDLKVPTNAEQADVFTLELEDGKGPIVLEVVPQPDSEDAGLFVNDMEVVRFRGEADGIAAVDRARELAERLSTLLSLDPNGMDTIKPVLPGENEQPEIRLHNETLLSVDAVTAKAAKLSAARLAFLWTNRLREALGEDTLEASDYAEFNEPPKPVYIPTGRRQVGEASWYGPGFHGRRTASGSRYNMYAMTAAHKTLPFGTLVRVTNQRNQKSCVVKITDRGPYAHGRIIDLSKGAASAIGMSGTARVTLEIVNRS